MVSRTLLVFCGLALLSISAVRAEDEAAAVADAEVEAEQMSYDGLTPAERSSVEEVQEKHEFQAEVHRLMDIIINSLYSNRDIFIRELISNASDALDKIRFISLQDKDALAAKEELSIRIKFDKDLKTLTLTDSGVGMSKAELIKNLGVVANSGTTAFVEAAASGQDALSLIGQFGVGFYSVYLVADKVTVISKSNDDAQYIWESAADKTFTVSEDPRGDTLGRGTSIILKLKEDAEEFLNQQTLENLVSKYSEFITFPIYLHVSETVSKEVPVEDEEEEEVEDLDKEDSEEEDLEVSDEEAEPKEAKTKTVTEEVWSWKHLNDHQAIWTRNPREVTDEEYQDFYKTLTKDNGGSMTHIHFKAEGEITFRSILYIPKTADSGQYDKYYQKSQALKLYVRKVLISDEFEDFMPRYLNFIRGIVDSEDLPLNVSRETLAQSRVLKVMSKKLTRKALEMLRKLAEESEMEEDEEDENDDESESEDEEEKPDRYAEFYGHFGKSIKLGVIEDRKNRNKLAKLLRFPTSKSDGELRSLEDYVEDMKDSQKFIYYITGSSMEQVQESPFIEKLTRRGFEVIYMTEALDEYVVQNLSEFDGHKLSSATKEGLKFGDEDESKEAELKEQFAPLTEWLQGVYGDKIEKVVVSTRLAQSPCVLVTGQYGWTANMERIMHAQTFGGDKKSNYMASKKTMEINPKHPIMREMLAKSEEDPDSDELKDKAGLMFDAAFLQSGFVMDDTTAFADRIHRVIKNGLGIDANEMVPEEVYEDEEEEDEEEEDEEEEGEEEEEVEEEEVAKDEL